MTMCISIAQACAERLSRSCEDVSWSQTPDLNCAWKMRAALLRFVSCMLKFPDDINTLCCILFSWHVWFASVSLNFTSWMSTCPQSCSRMNTFPTLFGACCRCNFSCVKYLVVDGWNPHDVHFFIDRFGSHTGAKILLGVVLFPFSLVLPSSDFVWQ